MSDFISPSVSVSSVATQVSPDVPGVSKIDSTSLGIGYLREDLHRLFLLIGVRLSRPILAGLHCTQTCSCCLLT